MKRRYYKVAVSYLVEVQADTPEEAKAKVADGDDVRVFWHTADAVGVVDYVDEDDGEDD